MNSTDGQKKINVNIRDANKLYMFRLERDVTPILLDIFEGIYKDCVQKVNTLKAQGPLSQPSPSALSFFRHELHNIYLWNSVRVQEKTDDVLRLCPDFMDLIKSIFAANAIIAGAANLGQARAMDIKLPQPHSVVHRLLIESAEEILSNLGLFDRLDQCPQLKYRERKREICKKISLVVPSVLMDLLPIHDIVRTHLVPSFDQPPEPPAVPTTSGTTGTEEPTIIGVSEMEMREEELKRLTDLEAKVDSLQTFADDSDKKSVHSTKSTKSDKSNKTTKTVHSVKSHRSSAVREPDVDSRDADTGDARDVKESKDSRDSRDSRDSKDAETRDTRDARDDDLGSVRSRHSNQSSRTSKSVVMVRDDEEELEKVRPRSPTERSAVGSVVSTTSVRSSSKQKMMDDLKKIESRHHMNAATEQARSVHSRR